MEVTKQQIQELRQQFLQKLEEDGAPDPGGFHQADLARVKNSDDWLRRFLQHHDLDMKEALKMLWDTCEWRKKFGTNDINENNVDSIFKEEGGCFAHNHDKDGKSLLIFRCKLHAKGQHDLHELKRYVVYWFERLERQDKGDQISLFFDMSDCGLANMDMEFTKYLIGLFKHYYPSYLNYIIVFDMAWVLNAAFKIIKTWLPAKAVERIKFTTRSSLKEYVTPDQALISWGGTDDYEYSFKPEMNGRLEDVKKKVHFAESSSSQGNSEHARDGKSMLSISPHEMISFTLENGELTGSLIVSNIHNTNVSFKIKTTSPEKFRVRPSTGFLTPGTSATINVLLQPEYQTSALARDKFLVMALPSTDPSMDVADLWKSGSSSGPVEQHRLRCSLDGSSAGDPSSTIDGSYGSTPDVYKQVADLSRQVTRLIHGQHELQSSLNRVRTLNYLSVMMLLVLIVALWYTVMKEQNQYSELPSHKIYSQDTDCADL